MFSIVSEKYKFVVGVDTHARIHAATIIDNLGTVVTRREFRVLTTDFSKFIDWSLRIVGEQKVLFAVEGTSSYGETLTQSLLAHGLEVTEVKPPKARSRGSSGKTDRLDSELAATDILRLPVDKLIVPRVGSERKILRVLLSSRHLLTNQQVMNKNALIALLRGDDLEVDARKPLAPAQYQSIAHWQISSSDTLSIIKSEARRLARNILAISSELADNQQTLRQLTSQLAPELLNESGIGPVTLAQVICSYSHKGRIHSAEAFASLAGTTPIPASSGNTTHYRLNRYGDRQLNHALTTIIMSRMRTDETTMEYVIKRTKDGLNTRDIKRSLKRYLARSLYKQLEACNILA